MITCKVCLSTDSDEVEAIGITALAGDISWRAAERACAEYGISRQSLQNHMEQHYTAAIARANDTELLAVESEFDASVASSVADLFDSMRMAPPEVKPLYAAAIRNLQGLRDTKPSQQHLIMALKTIQEMTGMKQEQRMLLQFAEQMFGEVEPARVKVIDVSSEPLALSEASYASSSEEVK